MLITLARTGAVNPKKVAFVSLEENKHSQCYSVLYFLDPCPILSKGILNGICLRHLKNHHIFNGKTIEP